MNSGGFGQASMLVPKILADQACEITEDKVASIIQEEMDRAGKDKERHGGN